MNPSIPNRDFPSGLDFLVASPVLRSPAAIRAAQRQFGKSVTDLILKVDCGPMPDSLHDEAMRLLATLQKPLPDQAPLCMRNDAWSDMQLWAQLGAWAEQRHMWALHSKLSVHYMGGVNPPKGMVAPYPEFFTGLAALTRRTANTFATAGLDQEFEVRTAASNLLALLNQFEKLASTRDEKEVERYSAGIEQLAQFQEKYHQAHKAELERDGKRGAWERLEKQLKDLAQRCAASGVANEIETQSLRMFFECRENIIHLLREFASVCDRLATLAAKPLSGQAITDDDANWIRNYGVTLARFHFYYGNSYGEPLDNFPIVTRVFSSPLTDSMFYAGVARPQALYVIIPDGKANQLYRGAVMTYGEFVRPNTQMLDDESWRELILKGQAPPAPAFTDSFRAEASVAELLKRLPPHPPGKNATYGDIQDTLWQIGSRADAKDVPALLEAMTTDKGEQRREVLTGMADLIARLPWQAQRGQLIEMLAADDHALADAGARILVEQPASLDPAEFVSHFPNKPTRARRLYCAILSRLPQQSESTHRFFLEALRDSADGVRWQAAIAIATAQWKDGQSTSALLECLNDTNELVGAAAAHALAQLGATNAAPALLSKLKSHLQATNTSLEKLVTQTAAVMEDVRSGLDSSFAYDVLDPYRLELRVGRRGRRGVQPMPTAPKRLPPQFISLTADYDYNLVHALIGALGDLKHIPAADDLFNLRGTEYDAAVTRALSKLVPDRLTGQLLAVAKDTKLDSYLRERALIILCELSLTNSVRQIAPLLEDVTPIVYSRPLPGPEWRICDRAAQSIALMLGWEHQLRLRLLPPPQLREELMKRAQEWAKSAR